jgi:hypothetical protein
MNVRAHDLVVILDGILGPLPGAFALGFHRSRARRYILIAALTDAAVRVLGEDLGLGPAEIRVDDSNWWLRARSESVGGDLCVEVFGPPHPRLRRRKGETEPPP